MMVIHLFFFGVVSTWDIETKCVLVGEIRPQTLNAAEEFKYPQILQDGPKTRRHNVGPVKNQPGNQGIVKNESQTWEK